VTGQLREVAYMVREITGRIILKMQLNAIGGLSQLGFEWEWLGWEEGA
jgi:hypothetical protein